MLLLGNGTKFSEAAGKIVANFKNDAVFSFDNLGRLKRGEVCRIEPQISCRAFVALKFTQ
ncbi:hypothetical protein [uncultured Campylobacter sp.]|uniref:hypothetical protein n=1 Tax=uncultured Campylobacter sp. TaxID=218934 RepID=UPI002618462C|nr:hypothetical protein [uncultured Campylobacter sp.]